MTSKEVAQLLKKWTESKDFRPWSDYMVHRTIAALDHDDFDFDKLEEKSDVACVEEFYEDESPESIEEIDEPTVKAADNWLTF
jgi:hypothetical protein